MPKIKPFRALKPAQNPESVVIRPLEKYTIEEIKAIASENPRSFLHLINPELENPFQRGTKQELIYKKINENLELFLENGVLSRADRPALYVYRITHDGFSQTGIWTVTHIDDYLTGKILKHESTVEEREKSLAEYLQQTGIDANPVLLTYDSNREINAMISLYMASLPDMEFSLGGSRHQLWSINYLFDLDQIIQEFSEIPKVYIADGHHRIASMAKMALHKRALNEKKHNGTERYNYFSTVYMSSEQVKVLEFNRLVRNLGGISEADFISSLAEAFEMVQADLPVIPKELHTIGMYLSNKWYTLKLKSHLVDEDDPVKSLDVSILQKLVLEPILHIGDPRTDGRIDFEGGRTAIGLLQEKVDSGAYVLAFTLFPVSVEQIMAVADVGGIMPPKSTWVEPKFLTGLLISYFN